MGFILLNISHFKESADIYCTNFHTKEILFLHVLQNLSIHKFLLFSESVDFVNILYSKRGENKNLSKLTTFRRNKRPIL